MRKYIKTVGGDESDGLSFRAKRYYNWKAGHRKYLKKKYNKRERKFLKKETRLLEKEHYETLYCGYMGKRLS